MQSAIDVLLVQNDHPQAILKPKPKLKLKLRAQSTLHAAASLVVLSIQVFLIVFLSNHERLGTIVLHCP